MLLDEVDKELEKRGHTFARYADDNNVYVKSRRAGERVMELLKRLHSKLKLRINASKSTVASGRERKFLGFSSWVAPGRVFKPRVAGKALAKMEARVRELTSRSRGRSIRQVVKDLRSYLVGWKNYFKLAETPRVFSDLDEWIRHRLRALHLKHWKRGKTIFRRLHGRGVSKDVAAQVAANARRWWHNSKLSIHIALPNHYLDELGGPRLAA